jgi:hypothetical protein
MSGDGHVSVGQRYRSPQQHMDDDGRLYTVVAVDGEQVTLDDSFKLAGDGYRQPGARRRTTTVTRLTRFWRLVR